MDKVNGAKAATQNMLLYYYQSLVEAGHRDPKQEIATQLPGMIQLSSEQARFVQAEIISDNSDMSISELLQNMIILMNEMDTTQSYLKENVTIVKRILEKLYRTVKTGEGADEGNNR